MVSGPFGRPGRNAVSRVAVERRADPDPAPIPSQNTEVKTVVETAKKRGLAMTSHVQVNNVSFILAFLALVIDLLRIFCFVPDLCPFSMRKPCGKYCSS